MSGDFNFPDIIIVPADFLHSIGFYMLVAYVSASR